MSRIVERKLYRGAECKERTARVVSISIHRKRDAYAIVKVTYRAGTIAPHNRFIRTIDAVSDLELGMWQDAQVEL